MRKTVWLLALALALCGSTRAGSTPEPPASQAPVRSWEQLSPTTSPPVRSGHTMVNLNGDVYLFGGEGAATNITMIFTQ